MGVILLLAGWRNHPPYNPKDIIANLLRVLEDDIDPLPMKPYYNGFNGIIEESEEGKFMKI